MKWTIVLSGLALAIAAVSPAHAASGEGLAAESTAALTPGAYLWSDADTGETVSVVVSLPDQRAYVYRGDRLVAATTVSTGKDGKETPTGVYPILQKEVDHHSNKYNDAPMPFMQRLTWDGVAIHAGRNPGFPASHGCVRVPAAFAKKLFEITGLGTVVSVVDYPILDPQSRPAELPMSLDGGSATARANADQLAALDAR